MREGEEYEEELRCVLNSCQFPTRNVITKYWKYVLIGNKYSKSCEMVFIQAKLWKEKSIYAIIKQSLHCHSMLWKSLNFEVKTPNTKILEKIVSFYKLRFYRFSVSLKSGIH